MDSNAIRTRGAGSAEVGAAWTGGQFSMVRALTGLAALGLCLDGVDAGGSHASQAVAVLVGGLAALGLSLGYRVRATGAVLLAVGALQTGSNAAGLWAAAPLGLGLLGLIAAPPAPFGSWEARGRVDPAAGWKLPRWIPDALAAALALWLLAAGLAGCGLLAGPWASEAFGRSTAWAAVACLAAPGLGLARRAPRGWALGAWLGAFGVILVGALAVAPGLGLALPALLLAFDPRWLPDPSEGWVDTVFYDGSCGLCHGAVRWLLAEDPEGVRFRYAPLGGEAFLAAVPPARRPLLPDSILVRTPDGAVLERSAAIGRLLARLGGLWGLLGLAWSCLPREVGDLAYSGVARVRHRLAAAPTGACPLLTPDLGRRFAP